MPRVTLDLDGESAAVLRAVRYLLKRLLRDAGVRCRAVRVETCSTVSGAQTATDKQLEEP